MTLRLAKSLGLFLFPSLSLRVYASGWQYRAWLGRFDVKSRWMSGLFGRLVFFDLVFLGSGRAVWLEFTSRLAAL